LLRVVQFDAGEDDLRASAGKFGLVWGQGKGCGAPDRAALGSRSTAVWDDFARGLAADTGIAAHYARTGGVKIAPGKAELAQREARLGRVHNEQAAAWIEPRMIGRDGLRGPLPAVGSEAMGASDRAQAGRADPCATLRALARTVARQPRVRGVRERLKQVAPGWAALPRGRSPAR